MRAITPVLDSGAGPNLIHLGCVAEPWRAAIKSTRSLPLIDASNRSMKALGELKLHARIGEFCARVPFLVVTNLAVDCIFGTTFLDVHMKAILPPQRKVLFRHAPSVALTGVTTSRHDRKMASRGQSQQLPQEEISADWKRAQFPANVPRRKIRVFKGVTIPPDDPSDGTRRDTSWEALLSTKPPQNSAQKCMPDGPGGHGPLPGRAIYGAGQQL